MDTLQKTRANADVGQQSQDAPFENGALIIGADFQGLGIARDLAQLCVPVVAVDPDFCIGRFSRYIRACHKCPPIAEARAFVNFLKELCDREGLNRWVVYPTSDMAVYVLSQHRDELRPHYLIPTPPWETTRYVYDKKLTAQLAEELKIPRPTSFFPESEEQLRQLELEYPVILKPTIKENFFPTARRKALRADSKDELLEAYRSMTSVIDPSEVMIQELIQGGPEVLYSFCCLFADGQVKARLVAQRPRQHPMDFGNATTLAVTCDIPDLEEPATRLLKAIDYYGLAEVEFMHDRRRDTFKLLEVNPRTWGWHTLGAGAGVNFSSLLFQQINDRRITANGFAKDVKWVRLLTDVAIAVSEMRKGRLTAGQYVRSLKGKREYAVCSLSDPLPFLVEVLLAPYFWYKRGF
ncbi:MAG: carboxylate--amine ligase [Planctomycetota bacterium]